MSEKKKKKGVFKKIAIATTILAALVGVTYATVPKVKEVVDEKVVDVIKQKVTDILSKDDLVELEPVTNLKFDEKTRTLTFDENPDAAKYRINVTTSERAFAIDSDTGSVRVVLPNAVNGDNLHLEVIAKGEYDKTYDSKPAILEITLQFANDSHYALAKDSLNDILRLARSFSPSFRVSSFEARSFDLQDNYLIIEGVGVRRGGDPINFTAKYDMTKYNNEYSSDLSNLVNYRNFMNYIRNHINDDLTITAELSGDYVNMSELLENKDAFKEYTDLGYEIETLQYSNSDVYSLSGEKFVEHTGIYRAVHKTLPSVTFKQTNTISIETEEEYSSLEDFLQDAKEQAIITEKSKEVYDATMNEHLIKTLEADTSGITKTTMERNQE